jgi:hypothetical protein
MTAAAAAAIQPGFLERKLPCRIILATFPFLTVPLVAALALTSDHSFLMVYIWLFGLTHFVLTLSVYLQSENLRHFREGARNIVLYFVIPLAILMGFYLVGVFELRARFPVFAVCFLTCVRALDFNHLNRQTFGVYQLFKARARISTFPAMKRTESAFFAALTALLYITFLAGGVSPLLQPDRWKLLSSLVAGPGPVLLPMGLLRVLAIFFALATLALGGLSLAMLIQAWRMAGRRSPLAEIIGYFGFQSSAALLAVVSSPLYFAALATHYVEYHVLMFPRCFHSRLDEARGVDRWFAGLRRHRVIFYGFLLTIAGVVLLFTSPAGSGSHRIGFRAIVSVFDGLFVFHYFVEMLIWKFSDPYFRRTLGTLYFAPRSR